MAEQITAIVKYEPSDYPWYTLTEAEMQELNPDYSYYAMEVPTAFLWCETQQLSVLSGELSIGGSVHQACLYPAMDSCDNRFYGKDGVIVAMGYESFIGELLLQEWLNTPKTTVYVVEL